MAETQTYPLAEKDFNDGCGFIFREIPLCEDEDGSYVYAYGHRDKATYALAVNDHDAEMGADTDEPYTSEHVKHYWAVAIQPHDGPDGWWVKWNLLDSKPITAATTRDFPMTVVER
jgi:hypothetical protein